jgi:hypothetical protein
LEDLKEGDHSEDIDVDGRIIFDIGWEGVDWMRVV